MNEVAVARPRVLTVIVSYNFEPWIERCLSSIRDSDYPSDLVVIDNASTDQTVSIIARGIDGFVLCGVGKISDSGKRITSA